MKKLFLLLFLASPAFAHLPSVNYAAMFFQTSTQAPAIRKVSALPATCTAVGSAASSNAVLYRGRVYQCTALDTWTAISVLTGTVTSVSVTTANGVSGSVATATTTPAITLTLGAITPSSVSPTGIVNVATGQTYRYNNVPVLYAQTALSNYYFGPAGNLTGSGSENTAVGANALDDVTSGIRNAALGAAALAVNSQGNSNMAIGYATLFANTTGSDNVAIGTTANASNTTASRNIAIGTDALRQNTTGGYNIGIGMQSLYDLNITDDTISYNVAIGYNAGRGITTGVRNTIIGANVTGLSGTLSNNVILADGGGTIRLQYDSSGNGTSTGGDFSLATAGKSLQLKTGSNACSGASALVGGTVTVATTCTPATLGTNGVVLITSQIDGGTPGWLRVSASVASTSFTITSSSGTDTSTVGWMIVKQN